MGAPGGAAKAGTVTRVAASARKAEAKSRMGLFTSVSLEFTAHHVTALQLLQTSLLHSSLLQSSLL
jgi:hypothetical protein